MIERIITLVAVSLIVSIIFIIFRKVSWLLISSVVGIAALFLFNSLVNADVPINIWTVLTTAIGGVIGFAAVVVLHFFGVVF